MSQCSSCAAPVRPVVAIDIDGTIAEYHQHLANHVARYFNKEGEWRYPWDGQGNYEDYLRLTQDQYREAKLSFRQGGFKRWSPPMDGLMTLRNTVKFLKGQYGLEVWITTTRPWNRLDSTDPDTRFWLDQHFPLYDHLLYHDHKYQELHRILGGDGRVVAVLEDLPEMCEESKQMFGWDRSYMVARHHNKWGRSMLPGEFQVASDLAAFAPDLTQKTVEWMINNG